jgi:hypothetical protein
MKGLRATSTFRQGQHMSNDLLARKGECLPVICLIGFGALLTASLGFADFEVTPAQRIVLKGDSISMGYGFGNYTNPSPLRTIQGHGGILMADNLPSAPAFVRLPCYWRGLNSNGTPITVATLAEEIRLNVAHGELKATDWFIYEDAGPWNGSVHPAPWPWTTSIYNNYREQLQNMLVEVRKTVPKDRIRLMTMFDYTGSGESAWDVLLDDGIHTANDCIRDEAKAQGIEVIDMNAIMDRAQTYITNHKWGAITGDGIHPNIYGNFVMSLAILKSLGAPSETWRLDALGTYLKHPAAGGDVPTIWGFTADPTDSERLQILKDLQKVITPG